MRENLKGPLYKSFRCCHHSLSFSTSVKIDSYHQHHMQSSAQPMNSLTPASLNAVQGPKSSTTGERS